MKRRILWAFMTVLTLGATFAISEAAIVYDNTTNPLGFWTPIISDFGTNGLVGDEITLAGTERSVTGIDLDVFSGYFGVTGKLDADVSFYNNNGSAGAPGTLIWDSGIVKDVGYGGLTNTFHFVVPSVIVPDTFTWTISLSNVRPDSGTLYNLGPLYYDPPTVGGSGDWDWYYSSGTWNKGDALNIVDNFGAEVHAEAVPEPSTFLLVGAGLAGVGLLRRRLGK